jgi:hypothetical protein
MVARIGFCKIAKAGLLAATIPVVLFLISWPYHRATLVGSSVQPPGGDAQLLYLSLIIVTLLVAGIMLSLVYCAMAKRSWGNRHFLALVVIVATTLCLILTLADSHIWPEWTIFVFFCALVLGYLIPRLISTSVLSSLVEKAP